MSTQIYTYTGPAELHNENTKQNEITLHACWKTCSNLSGYTAISV